MHFNAKYFIYIIPAPESGTEVSQIEFDIAEELANQGTPRRGTDQYQSDDDDDDDDDVVGGRGPRRRTQGGASRKEEDMRAAYEASQLQVQQLWKKVEHLTGGTQADAETSNL